MFVAIITITPRVSTGVIRRFSFLQNLSICQFQFYGRFRIHSVIGQRNFLPITLTKVFRFDFKNNLAGTDLIECVLVHKYREASIINTWK